MTTKIKLLTPIILMLVTFACQMPVQYLSEQQKAGSSSTIVPVNEISKMDDSIVGTPSFIDPPTKIQPEKIQALILNTKNDLPKARRTFTPTSVPPPWKCRPGTIDSGFVSANKDRTFRIHIPAQVASGQNLPLLLALHGTSGTSIGMEFVTKANVLADREGFIVVYPQGIGDPFQWNVDPTDEENEDLDYFERLFYEVFDHCPVDRRRVYVTGISNGGGMTHRLACNFSKIITAIAPVAGAYPFPNICSIERPVPVIAFHGMADPIVLYDGTGASDVLDQTTGAWPSLPYWAHGWAMRDFCPSRPVTTTPKPGIFLDTWKDCRDGAEVLLYSFENGGHTWPGGPPFTEDMGAAIPYPDATRTMWEFFKRFAIPEE